MSCCYGENNMCAGCDREMGDGICGRDDGWSDHDENEFRRKENVSVELGKLLENLLNVSKKYMAEYPPSSSYGGYDLRCELEAAEVGLKLLKSKKLRE